MHSMHDFKWTKVDLHYIILLFITLSASGAVAFSMLEDYELTLEIIDDSFYSMYGRLILGLAPFPALLIGWRMVMAWCYKPMVSVKNAKLPSVTIVIPAYNEGSQVLSTIRSVMASDYPADKMSVICVDDGSQDDTWKWMSQGAQEFPQRIRLVRQPVNTGKRHALLAGFRQARGSVFVTLDSDSEILPDTLRLLVSPFARSPKIGAVAGNVRILNLADGLIPKLLDLSFTMAFDFLRRGQSVYGGVLCTPGALSAYRASVIKPSLEQWADQTFLGRPANIGEDRALSNIVLRGGHHITYQRDAIVNTKVPCGYKGLCRMLLRWARSNVRECLVMTQFLYGRFRRPGDGAAWVRVAGTVELLLFPLMESMKVGLLLTLLLHPLSLINIVACGCTVAAILPACVYFLRRPTVSCYPLALTYAIFWVFGLSWVTFWGLYSAGCSGWLTRRIEDTECQHSLASV